MNLAQVLHEALPEAPPPNMRDVYPRVHPNLIAREHKDREGTMVRVIPPGGELLFRLTKPQYELVKLFDGQRSYAEVAQLFRQKNGIPVTEMQVKSFADSLDKGDFWYRTPQEQSILLCHKLMHDRHQHVHGAMSSDLARLDLLFFDPDNYLAWAYSKLKFMYTPWFFAVTLVMFLVSIGLLSARWDELWSDSVSYYNLTDKGWYELGIFFLAFVLLGAVHETAHGMTVKHFGAGVHKMGFYLVYGVPALFCDVTEVYVYGGRWARIMTTFAGVWSEMMLASVMTIVWWFTPRGTFLHDFCYTVILAGGILVVLINWNPFSKLDGYFLFNEIFHFFDIKSQSTTFLVAWIRKNVFRLPAKVPLLSTANQVAFAAYALLSGFYCYGMLLFFVRISYKVGYKYSPTWAFLPAAMLALFIFKSRIRKLFHFFKEVYVDKKPLLIAHSRPLMAGAVAVALLLGLPIFRESTEQRFILRPVTRALLRAEVPGEVAEVLADEGQTVTSGQAVVRLRNLEIDSAVARANMRSRVANVQLARAQLVPASLGSAMAQAREYDEEKRGAASQNAQLTVTAPISGIVLTPRVHDLTGSMVRAGTPLVEIGDVSTMEARIFIPEVDMDSVADLTRVSLRPEGFQRSVTGEIVSVSPAAENVDAGMVSHSKYKGMRLPVFYVITVRLPNDDGRLRPGTTGTVKLYGRRRPLIVTMLKPFAGAIARRLW